MAGEKWTVEDGTMLDQRLDPLKHTDGVNLEKFLTDDEEAALEISNQNDPEITGVDMAEITAETDFPSFITSNSNIGEYLEEANDEVPFEERDILGDSLRRVTQMKNAEKQKAAKEGPKNEKEQEKIDQFNLMEACAKYQASMKAMPELMRSRPVYADGTPISDEKIAQQAAEYGIVDKEKKYSEFNEDELKIMRKCSSWNYFYQKIKNKQTPPTSKDGKLLSNEDIAQQAKSYEELKSNNPEKFAKLKVESGKWNENNFFWKKNNFKGKEQYYCYKSRVINFGGAEQKVVRKYISEKKPAKQEGNFYYTVKRDMKIKDGYSVAVIDLKDPTALANKKKEGVAKEQLA